MNIVLNFYVSNEFVLGLTLCNEIALGKKSWEDLFEPVSFFSMYKCVFILEIMSCHVMCLVFMTDITWL